MGTDAKVISTVPPVTLGWLLEPENPAVAVLTRRTLLGEPDSRETTGLSARRNDYAPVKGILDAIREDGSWDVPSQDYRKYGGSLWQIVFLGEMYASGGCHRVQRGAAYAFSRQLPDGSWSATTMRPAGQERLTDRQRARLAAAFTADERHVEVEVAYRCAQQLRSVYHQTSHAAGRRIAIQVLDTLPGCPIPEIARLGRTLKQWRTEFLGYFDTGGANNGGTEAVNGLIELPRRIARGFRNLDNYRLRMLLIGGGLTHPHLR